MQISLDDIVVEDQFSIAEEGKIDYKSSLFARLSPKTKSDLFFRQHAASKTLGMPIHTPIKN